MDEYRSGALREVEIKLAIGDVEPVERRLRALGFVIRHPRMFERNTVFDTAHSDLRGRGELIRVRTTPERNVLTYKGAPEPGKHKEREELEVEVNDSGLMAAILERLAYLPRFRYEKYRTEWQRDAGTGLVMVDECPIGNFLEIEGPPEWIDYTAGELGFAEAEYLRQSYARLYVEDCTRRGVVPSHMTF